jgi:hypothetical protein
LLAPGLKAAITTQRCSSGKAGTISEAASVNVDDACSMLTAVSAVTIGWTRGQGARVVATTADSGWRVTLVAAVEREAEVERTARRFDDQVSRVDGRQLVSYFDSEDRARGAIAAQHENALVRYELAWWDDGQVAWMTVDQVGEQKVGEQNAVRRSRAAPTLVIAALSFVVFFLTSYFIPGASDTPNAGPHHDLGRSVGFGLLAAVICPAVLAIARRRDA